MKELPKELETKIVIWIESQMPIKMYWDYNSRDFDKRQLLDIIENGLNDYYGKLWEMNSDYIFDMEYEFAKNVFEEFEEELLPYLEEVGNEETEIREYFMDYIHVDMNVEELLRNQNVTVLFNLHSNYDCCNSGDSDDDINEPETYLGDIFNRVKAGIAETDFLQEKHNMGSASLFCFVTKMGLLDFLKINERWKEEKTKALFIPHGTQFGFFSSMYGSGSMFSTITHSDLLLPIIITNYDFIGILADVEQSYSMADVYGGTDFVDDVNISLVYEQ